MLRNSTTAGQHEIKEIVFEADEDLYQAPSMRIVMLKSETRALQISRSARSFQSYVNEMCGYVSNPLSKYNFQHLISVRFRSVWRPTRCASSQKSETCHLPK